MTTVFVITELKQIPPADRWARFIAPLAKELEESGLGEILDLDDLRLQASSGSLESDEVAITLSHFHYGQELVERHMLDAGLTHQKSDKPTRWRDYPGDDYFSSNLAQDGYWDEDAQVWLISPARWVEEDVEAAFLQVGMPGVDNIGFGYRKGELGFWAYHRMGQEFQHLAPTIKHFLEGWLSGQITV